MFELLLVFIFLIVLLFVRAIIVLFSRDAADHPIRDLSIVIPLKGWDASLPELLKILLKDPFDAALEIIVVIDQNQINRKSFPLDDRLTLLETAVKPKDWLDKNWRLYQRAKRAKHGTVLFMDSDTQPYPQLLNRRCRNHRGGFSFCIPVYAAPKSHSERFLSSFTSYNNFFIYSVIFSFGFFGTAIGPSMMSSVPKEQLLYALEEGKSEFADDHALGNWMDCHGVPVHISKVPVVVGKDGESWAGAIQQIIRWISVTRTVGHILSTRLILSTAFCLIINIIPTSAIYGGFIAAGMGYEFGLLVAVMGIVLSVLDGFWLALVERSYVLRCDMPSSGYWHILYVLIMHLVQPFMIVYAWTRKEISWRGGVIVLETDRRTKMKQRSK